MTGFRTALLARPIEPAHQQHRQIPCLPWAPALLHTPAVAGPSSLPCQVTRHTCMDDKQAREAYRVRQFASPHPALQQQQEAAAEGQQADRASLAAAPAAADASDPLNIHLVPDHERVILHFDVDCFYAQVEECRNPSLRGLPLAVTQKYLIVTCNYAARQQGVTKLMGIKDAKKACPQLVLVPGEDLSPYRAASRDIRAVLSRWGPTEKLGLDESWVDVTQEVNRRLAAAAAANTTAAIASSPWCGHLVNSGLQLTSHSRHRPMDLRVLPQQQQQQEQEQHRQAEDATGQVAVAGQAQDLGGLGGPAEAAAGPVPAWLPACELRLKLGAVVAAEMRQAVKAEAGFRCSAGIACCKLLSKLVSGLHKPDDQTCILPTHAQAFVAPLPVRALPGVGYKANTLLQSWGVATAADARAISKQQLIQGLGDKHGTGLFHACRGVDPTPVVASGPPKSITVEDSFKSCASWQGVAQVLQVLVPDLLDRLAEDAEEFPQLHRTPSTLTVKWRKAGSGWARSSASTPWPAAAKVTHGRGAQQPAAAAAGGTAAVSAVTAAASSLLKQHLPASGFSLTLLNVGATFKSSKAGPGVAGGIQQFLTSKQPPLLPAAAAAAAPVAAASAAGEPSTAAAGLAGSNLLQQARAATEARRDYSRATSSSSLPTQLSPGASGQVAMLTKRQERRLWELAMQQQQQGAAQAGMPSPQQQQQQQQHHHHNQQHSSPPQPPGTTQAVEPLPKRQCLPSSHIVLAVCSPQQAEQDPAGNADAGAAAHSLQANPTLAASAANAVMGGDPSEAAPSTQPAGGTAGDVVGAALEQAQHAAGSAGGCDGGGAAWAGGPVAPSWCCTTLHCVDGLGMVACEVLEEYEGDCSSD